MTTPPWLCTKDDAVEIALLVAPRASRSRVVGVHDGRLKVAITAPPVDGAANAAITKMFSKLLGIPPRDITLKSGQTGRRKVIRVSGVAPEQVEARLS